MGNESTDYRVDRRKGVWTFMITRPKTRNSLTMEVRYALFDIIAEAERSPECGVLIVTGEGDKAFCSGGSVQNQEETFKQSSKECMDRVQGIGEIARRIMTTPIIVISAVNGAAFGGGCFMALAADIVVAQKNASFGFGFSKRGLVPDWAGFFTLPRLVGMARAKNLLLRGVTLDAQRAFDMGMIAELVESDALSKANEIAAEIAEGPRVAFSMVKRVVARSFETSLEGLLNYEMLAQTIARSTDDHHEGVRAFLQKRKPVFKGH